MSIEIAARIKNLRKNRGLTATQLAEQSDCSPSTISEVENGKVLNPAAITVAKIAKALGVTTDYLVFGDESIDSEKKNSAFFRKYTSLPEKTKGALQNLLDSMDNED